MCEGAIHRPRACGSVDVGPDAYNVDPVVDATGPRGRRGKLPGCARSFARWDNFGSRR